MTTAAGEKSRLRGMLLWPLAIAAPVLIGLQTLDGDREVSGLFYDAAAGKFPLRNDWWLTHVFHDGVRSLVIAFAVVLLAGCLSSLATTRLRRHRRTMFFLVCAMTLSASAVALTKYFSIQACPYDLHLYGGDAPQLALFEAAPTGYPRGRCWPGGHASTAFSLFALYFAALRASRPRLAAGLLAFVLVFGAVLSVVQTARGAHFLSHQVWTALFCWYATLVVYRCVYPDTREVLGSCAPRPGSVRTGLRV